jgi:RNA polymerase sigma factor (sigma-70 family)
VRASSEDTQAKDPQLDLVRQALDGDRHAVRQLVVLLLPVIQRRAATTFSRYGYTSKSDVEDVCQEVLVGLFREDRAALASWDPDRGLGLEQFAGMLAQRRVISYLRSRSHRPLGNTFVDLVDVDLADGEDTAVLNPHENAHIRQTLQTLADSLRASLSPLGVEMFYRLYVWEQPTAQIAEQLHVSPDSVYQWRSRLKKTLSSLIKDRETPI